MLNENTHLVLDNLGPYIAIGLYGTKEEIAETLTPFYNQGAFDGEVIFKSDTFGYVTGPSGRAWGGIYRHFQCQMLRDRPKGQKGAAFNREARRRADVVWRAAKNENFLKESEVKKFYAEPAIK